MLFLLRNGWLRLPVLFLALLVTGELSRFPEMTEAYQNGKRDCETCGLEYDDCPSSKPAVECEGTSFCFKTYNTFLNRLQKGCSNGTTQAEWESITRLGWAWGKQSVCFDATEANLARIKKCQGNQWKSNCSFETVPQFNQSSQGAPDVSKMTSKMCICEIDDKGPCNEGDVPGFEEIQRAKVEVNQCYTSLYDRNKPDAKWKPEAVTKWCQTKYCSITKKREYLFEDFITGDRKYSIIYNRGCADHYEDPLKTLECLKGSEGGCMNVKKLRECSPVKSSWLNDPGNKVWIDYNGNDTKEDMKECICEGNLCNDKPMEDIKLDTGEKTENVVVNKKFVFILIVLELIEAFCRRYGRLDDD